MNILFKIIPIYLFLPYILYPQSQEIKFERISLEHGLSHAKVNCIIQDQQGFMWFGTGSGLCRYDGFKFNVYKNNKNDKKSLRTNKVSCLYVDRHGALWIGAGMLHKYNQKSDDFTRFVHNKRWGTGVNDIKEDRFGNLWLSVNGNRLVRFNRLREQFSDVLFSMKKDTIDRKFQTKSILISQDDVLWVATTRGLYKHKLPLPVNKNNIIVHVDTVMFIECNRNKNNRMPFQWTELLYEDSKNNIWLSPTQTYLTRYNAKENNFKHYHADQMNKFSIRSERIDFINEDDNGRIIVGTDRGCSVFDQNLERYVDRYLKDSILRSFFLDHTGVTWFGTEYEGIIKISNENRQFQPLWKYSTDAILEDKAGNLWLGGQSGLHKLDPTTGEYTLYEIGRKSFLDYRYENHILSLCEGIKNQLWIGAKHGLYIFDKVKQKFLLPVYQSLIYQAAGKNDWHIVFIDKKGLIWLANKRANGLFLYDPHTNFLTCFSHVPNDENTLSANSITKIYLDSRGIIWIGTRNGLNKFDKYTNNFKRFYLTGPGDINRRSGALITDIIEQQNNPNGPLWISTESGLYQFDQESGEFTNCRLANGQAVNDSVTGIICRIAEDNAGNIWFSSHNGLGNYNPVNHTLKKYDKSDGLQGNYFTNAHFKSRNGEMFFGSANGCSAFFPDSIKDDLNIPEIVITTFKKFNEVATLDSNITNLKQITLTHEENVFSFEYAALNFINPRKNQFAHKMEGFDKDWIYTGNKHDVTYTNLDPGEYTFHVKGSNSDGIWNEHGTSLRIIITPPWWQTNSAYLIYVLLLGTIIFAAWRFQTNRLRMKHQLEFEHLRAESLEEVDFMKSRFFANISHEFRTPLTLIKGPVNQILDGEFAGNLKDQCKMILRNCDRLLGLINQILDLSKLESGEMKLQIIKTEIVQFLKAMMLTFSLLADRRKVTLKFTPKQNLLTGYIDRDKLEKILTNLLSNAFKYTPEGGQIILECGMYNADFKTQTQQFKISTSNFIEIKVSNTGPGIPPEQMDRIFNRFFQADTTYKKDSDGSGIGLALAKELVELHHGKMIVSCQKNPRGQDFLTSFTFQIPVNIEHFKAEEIIEGPVLEETKEFELIEKEVATLEEEAYAETTQQLKKYLPLLLIIEDNPDVITFIKSILKNDYRIITAINGKIGWTEVMGKYPNLIISDVMMPEMDGFDFCKKLKSDQRTSHIPVILLTAKADLDSKIEGLEFGADEYISKPFEADELKVRAKNLIEQRRKMREKFSQIIEIKPGDVTASSMDKQFLERLMKVSEKHLSESGYSTENLAREVGISRSQLNRKLRALTDLSTHGFILNMRLKRAIQLLKNRSGTITEIGYSVGFNNPANFARAFKNQYGQSPRNFIKENL